MSTRACTGCKAALPATLEYFHAEPRSPSGLDSRCKKCCSAYDRDRRSKRPKDPTRSAADRERMNANMRRFRRQHPDRIRTYNHKNRLRPYGLTPEGFDALAKKQDGRCAICRETLDLGKKTHVDHDHASGHVRGLLCSSCNPGLGLFRDDEDLLQAAILYLRRTKLRRVV